MTLSLWMTLTWHAITKKFRRVLRKVQGKARTFLSAYRFKYLFRSTIPITLQWSSFVVIVTHFIFDLTCDVIIDPEANKFDFPSMNFPVISNAF